MNYQQTIDYLFAQLPMYQNIGASAYKANLDYTIKLDDHFNSPHKHFKIIHVAGTNGKGSVSHMLASILQESGLKTGLYTSPHLVDFRERIKINGEMIGETDVVEFVRNNKGILDEIKPSFFEMTVAMAYNYFSELKVDVAVVEVGMGGRLDSTNIITPIVSIITNIGFDHVAFLGNTLAKIASEKAGIIKQYVPVVIGEYHNETAPVFVDVAYSNKAPIFFADTEVSVRLVEKHDFYQKLEIFQKKNGSTLTFTLDLLGDYQKKNFTTVFGALQILTPQFNLPKEAIVMGLAKVIENTKLFGRWYIVHQNPKVICDTGHNAEGIKYVINQLKNETYNKLHIVMGMVNDKEIDKMLELFPKEAQYYFTQANIARALDCQQLQAKAKVQGLEGNSYKSVPEAYNAAICEAGLNDVVFVGGSTFVVGDLLKHLKQ